MINHSVNKILVTSSLDDIIFGIMLDNVVHSWDSKMQKMQIPLRVNNRIVIIIITQRVD